LDKQLALLEKFAFLKKLELFGNPVAEEPDYRLRLIYQVPQVEILDKSVVKDPERLKADEVVPNLDKASAPKPEKGRPKGDKQSLCEKDCFRDARTIKAERQKMEDEAMGLGTTFMKQVEHEHARQGLYNTTKARLRELRRNPREISSGESATMRLQEQTEPSSYEKLEMRAQIEKLAKDMVVEGTTELTRDNVVGLAEVLATSGIEHVGRMLGDKNVLPSLRSGSKTSKASLALTASAATLAQHPVEKKLMADPEATVGTAEVIDWLLQKPWPRCSDDALSSRIKQLQEEQMWEHYGRNYDALHACLSKAREVIPAGDSKEDIVKRVARLGGAPRIGKDEQTQKDIVTADPRLAATTARLSTDLPPGDMHLLDALPLAVRLEGFRSGKQEVQILPSQKERGTMQKHRADVYKQTFLYVKRTADDQVEGQVAEEHKSRLAAPRKHNARWPKAATSFGHTSLGG